MGIKATGNQKQSGGFVAFASLGLLLFLFGIFTFTFFLQTNFAKRTQAVVIRSQAQTLASISATSSRFLLLGGIDWALATNRNQNNPIQAFLSNEGSRALNCPASSSSFWVVEGANYTLGSCAAFIRNVATTAFNQNPISTGLTPHVRKRSGATGVYPYSIFQYPLRYATVSLMMSQGLEVPASAGVTVGQADVFLLRPSGSAFPYPFWFYAVDPTTLPRSYPSGPNHVWNAPVLFAGLASSSSYVYPTYFPSFDLNTPPVFAMGLHLSGCSVAGQCATGGSTSLNNALMSSISTSGTSFIAPSLLLPDPYRPAGRASSGRAYLGMGATYAAHPMVNNTYFSNSALPFSFTPTHTYNNSGSLTLEVWADTPTQQSVRLLDASGNQVANLTFTSGNNIVYFPNASTLRVRVPQGKIYAIAPRSANTLLFLTQSADIWVEGDLLAHGPHCTRPIEVRYTDSGYELVEECSGPLHSTLFGLATRYGSIQFNFLKPTMNFNGVFFAAPYGSFRLAPGATPVPGTGVTSSSTINFHLVGGVFARTFGPWHNASYSALNFNFYMSDLPMSSSASWQNWVPVPFTSTANLSVSPVP